MCQHPGQKATSSRLLCWAMLGGIPAQVLLALPQYEGHLRQHHHGSGVGGEGGTSVGVNDVRTHSSLNPYSLHVAVGSGQF